MLPADILPTLLDYLPCTTITTPTPLSRQAIISIDHLAYQHWSHTSTYPLQAISGCIARPDSHVWAYPYRRFQGFGA